jgi:cephalosporin hydroxylase
MYINFENATVEILDAEGQIRRLPFASAEAFREVSKAWLRVGWDVKYVYGFTWLGRPIIQLPDDMLRLQEVIYRVRPDVIIETGIAHGGSLIYSASLCHLMGRGRVIGVDIDIRKQNRQAIEAHALACYITMFEGSSIADGIVRQVCEQVRNGEVVIVLLDSCHTRNHVLAELECYGPLVTSGSYIVAMDGIMQELEGAPRAAADWKINNPQAAVREFLRSHPEFVLDEPLAEFNEGIVADRVTYWPNAFLKRVKSNP